MMCSSDLAKLISYVLLTFLIIPTSPSQLPPFNFNNLFQIPLSAFAFFTLSQATRVTPNDQGSTSETTPPLLLPSIALQEKGIHALLFRSLICSAVQLCGFFLCLMGAARITHRAQGIVSIASKWHMMLTNASAESDQWDYPVLLLVILIHPTYTYHYPHKEFLLSKLDKL
ncbi:hypothetical protein VNO78_01036 [Psophocarpus tetragonolobus]|uniref:Uncharacterized protein n=1 Tax=Psophocarpus tetragonolobus TaxID=3891 RepID=A0AAN9SXL8_PSOTE